jgi:hypothetical protein
LLATVFGACRQDELRTYFPDSTPVIESASIYSENETGQAVVLFGDSIVLEATVLDAKTPLSTLQIEIIVNDNLVQKATIRTAGNQSTVREKYKIPLTAHAGNNSDVEIYLKLTNVEGNTVEKALTGQMKAVRPTFGDPFYFVLQDGNVIEAHPEAGNPDNYQSEPVNIAAAGVKFKIAQKLTGDRKIDYSGFVWGDVNGELALCAETDPYFEYRDPLILVFKQLFFNVYSFDFSVDAERRTVIQIDGVELTATAMDGVDYLTVNKTLAKDQIVTFGGFNDLPNTLHPDFFETLSTNQAKFTGWPGTYQILYNPDTGFLYIEQPEAQYPDALWLDGTGMGFPGTPYLATTSWNWNKPEDYIFCRKIENGVFQATFYSNRFDMKFFHQRMWGDEENSSNYTLTPVTLMAAGRNDQGAPNGNWVAGVAFTPGVYRVVINLNNKTSNIERIQ